MIKKREKQVFGVTEELPEGIFGLLSSSPDSLAKPKSKSKSMDKILASIRADTLGLNSSTSASRKKSKAVDPSSERPTRVAKAKKKPSSTKVMPDFVINYDKALPKEASGLALDNVVNIPEELLTHVTAKTQVTAKTLSRLMLSNSATSVLAFDAASSYVRTVLDDGLGIEVDVDRGVLEVVKDLSRLDVVFFFVRRLAMPMAFKRKFMQVFTEDLAKQAFASMQKTNKSESMSQQLRELEGVLVKRSENKPRVHRSGGGSVDAESKLQGFIERKNEVQAVKRSRSAGPSSNRNSPTGM